MQIRYDPYEHNNEFVELDLNESVIYYENGLWSLRPASQFDAIKHFEYFRNNCEPNYAQLMNSFWRLIPYKLKCDKSIVIESKTCNIQVFDTKKMDRLTGIKLIKFTEVSNHTIYDNYGNNNESYFVDGLYTNDKKIQDLFLEEILK